ncbi:MAG: hypothetical protein QM535_15025 [Limnohabitans sp.]|nr:hypothetical protein [Limnohabitans sp.]
MNFLTSSKLLKNNFICNLFVTKFYEKLAEYIHLPCDIFKKNIKDDIQVIHLILNKIDDKFVYKILNLYNNSNDTGKLFGLLIQTKKKLKKKIEENTNKLNKDYKIGFIRALIITSFEINNEIKRILKKPQLISKNQDKLKNETKKFVTKILECTA